MTMDTQLIEFAIFSIQLLVFSSLIYQVITNSRKIEQGESRNNPPSRMEINPLESYVPRRTISESITEDYLSTDELKVLSLVMSRRGEVYQAEIARELNVPKSTVSRIIRRLQDRGLIIVRRIGRLNYIDITDTDYVTDLLRKRMRRN